MSTLASESVALRARTDTEEKARALSPEEKALVERELWWLWKTGLDYYIAGSLPTYLAMGKGSVFALRKASRKAFLRAAERGKGTLKRSCWAADYPESQFYRSDVPVLADGGCYEIHHVPQYAFRTSRGLSMGIWYPDRHLPRTKAELEKAKASIEEWRRLLETGEITETPEAKAQREERERQILRREKPPRKKKSS